MVPELSALGDTRKFPFLLLLNMLTLPADTKLEQYRILMNISTWLASGPYISADFPGSSRYSDTNRVFFCDNSRSVSCKHLVHVGSSTTVVSVSFFGGADSAGVEFVADSDFCCSAAAAAAVVVVVVVVVLVVAAVVVFSVSLLRWSRNWSEPMRNSDFGQQLHTRDESSRSLLRF